MDPARWQIVEQGVGQLADPETPHSCTDKLGGTAGSKADCAAQGPVRGNKASNFSLKTPVGIEAAVGETPSLTGEVVGETHKGLECTQAYPLAN